MSRKRIGRRRKSSQRTKRSSERSLRLESLETRTLLAADFFHLQNPMDSADVNGDGEVAPIDVLTIVNEINSPGRDRGERQVFFDVNGDAQLTPFDALAVMNRLNRRGSELSSPDSATGDPAARDRPGGDRPDGPTLEFENRTLDGTGNNLTNLDQGAAETNLIRFGYPAVYPDGHGDVLETVDQPNARDVSNLINDQDESIVNDRHLTDWIVQWGQFLTHDLDLTGNGSAFNELSDGTTGEFSIAVDDPQDPIGPNAIPFNRSAFDPATGTPDLVDSDFGPRANWREQINSVTSYIDASNVYGSDDARAAALRSFEGGRLLVSDDGLLPQNTDGLPNDDPFHLGEALFVAGDIRANEQVGLTATHTIFVREHNRLAGLIQERAPDLSDEEIYQLARKIVGAEMQAITYNEFLPALLGDEAPSADAARYDETVDGSITNSFATAMFRYGHSMQSSELLLVDDTGENVGSLSLSEAFFDPTILGENPENVDLILKGLATQEAQENDAHLVDEIRNFLFGPPGAGGLDLAALDIQRGRDHGLPDFNSLREFYGLERVEAFDEISSDAEVQAALEQLYGDVDNIDAWVGGIAEDHLEGTSVGATVNAVVANQFVRLRDGDRFFFTHDPALQTRFVREIIDLNSITLADIIRSNTGITDIQDNVFFEPGVLIHQANRHPADVVLASRDDTVSILPGRGGERLDSRLISDLSQVILVGTDGRQTDRFVLDASVTSQSLDVEIQVIGGEGRRDVLVVRGGEGLDRMVVDGNELIINDTRVALDGVELLQIDLGGGEDDLEILSAGDLEIDIVGGGSGGGRDGRGGGRR